MRGVGVERRTEPWNGTRWGEFERDSAGAVDGLIPFSPPGASRSAVQSPAALSPRPPLPQAGEGENSIALRLASRTPLRQQSAQADFVMCQLRFQPPGAEPGSTLP